MDYFEVFQALKFTDTNPGLAERIRMLPTARMAQQEAKKQIRHRRVDWLEVNVAMMEKVLEMKFRQHRHLRNLLRSTGSRELIEDSPVCSSLIGDASQVYQTLTTLIIDRLVLGHWERRTRSE